MKHQKHNTNYSTDILLLSKAFFGFGDDPTPIEIIFPSAPRTRKSSLECENYPLFTFEVSPDDMLSGTCVLSLLTAIYGKEKVKLKFTDQFNLIPPEENRVLIGGPPTNFLTGSALDGKRIRFSDDSVDRKILCGNKPYCIEFDEAFSRKSMVKDYCLISKSPQGRNVVFSIAGLRAYGQAASYGFLSDQAFYTELLDLVEEREFQILIEVSINRRLWGPCRIIEKSVKPIVFISHVHEDHDKIIEFVDIIKKSGMKVWIDDTDIDSGREWKKSIQYAIENCDCFVACFSSNYLKRQKNGMNDELLIANREAQRMRPDLNWFFPVILEDGISLPNFDIGSKKLHEIQFYNIKNGQNIAAKSIFNVANAFFLGA